VRQQVARSKWPKQFWCVERIVRKESMWQAQVKNPISTARGLFQIIDLPPHTSVKKQYERFERYIANRYGSPCKAWEAHKVKGWY
jgi:hypothetical protein